MFQITVTDTKTNETKVYRPLAFLEKLDVAAATALHRVFCFLGLVSDTKPEDDPYTRELLRRAEIYRRRRSQK